MEVVIKVSPTQIRATMERLSLDWENIDLRERCEEVIEQGIIADFEYRDWSLVDLFKDTELIAD